MLNMSVAGTAFFMACILVLDDTSNAPATSHKAVAELIRAVREGDLPSTRIAWQSSTNSGAAAVVPLLLATPEFTKSSELNWIISATHRAVDQAIEQKDKIDAKTIAQILGEKSSPSVMRRLALDVMEKYQPGFRTDFLKRSQDDPEFLREQIFEQINQALHLRGQQQENECVRLLTDAYHRAGDGEQIATAFRLLNDPTIQPKLHLKLGVITKWNLIGPFPSEKEKGHETQYPVDLAHASQPIELHKHTPVKFGDTTFDWTPVQVPHDGASLKFSLAFPGKSDSVSFAYTMFDVAADQQVEILASGGETLELWLNGEKIIDAPFYNQRPRMDRHRARAKLVKGTNAILAKVCTGEGAGEGGGRGGSPTGELILRITTPSGQGMEVNQ